jgi:hypothetical protein
MTSHSKLFADHIEHAVVLDDFLQYQRGDLILDTDEIADHVIAGYGRCISWFWPGNGVDRVLEADRRITRH